MSTRKGCPAASGTVNGSAHTSDVELRDKTIKAGDRVMLVYPSANRDEEVFDDPFTFDVTRARDSLPPVHPATSP